MAVGEHIGMVKWFNHKLGYGFVTVKLNNEDKDIFVHQTNVHPTVSTYRTLSTGEYVSLNVSESNDSTQAVDVTGVNGGPLMCDHHIRKPHPSQAFSGQLEESQLEAV